MNSFMDEIKAVGFDLFNTLITAEPGAVQEALGTLTRTLKEQGFHFTDEAFKHTYREAALEFIEAAHREGRETHNRFWISATLNRLGHSVEPEDSRIETAIEAYFAMFPSRCHLLPETERMLSGLKDRYRLGLLSNFTHAPAAVRIIQAVGLGAFFDVQLISGDLGYRKPHPTVFQRLVEQLGVEPREALFVGDDLDADVYGALRAGLKPVWTTVVRDQDIPAAQTLLPKSAEVAEDGIPRISAWSDLTDLLADAA